jgi:hypothetical protein
LFQYARESWSHLFACANPFLARLGAVRTQKTGSGATYQPDARPAAKLNRHRHNLGVPFATLARTTIQAPVAQNLPAPAWPRRSRVMSIAPLLANSSFDPEAVEVLSGAYEDAWEKLKQSGSSFTRPAFERGAREILAKCIIEMAQRGERDRGQLSEAALTYLAENYRD